MKAITEALAFVADKFKDTGQDLTGQPFINHPIAVLNQLTQAEITDQSTLIAGLLHDIRIYSDTTEAQITSHFGQGVTDLVNELHYDKATPKDELMITIIDRVVDLSPEAQQITLADLTANITDDYYASDSSDFIRRKRSAFTRAVVNEMLEPHPALLEQFNQAMSEFCEKNGIDSTESFWTFLSPEDREKQIAQLELEVKKLEQELEIQDAAL